MPQRRIQSLLHGGAAPYTVYHHEHRPLKTRSIDYRGKRWKRAQQAEARKRWKWSGDDPLH